MFQKNLSFISASVSSDRRSLDPTGSDSLFAPEVCLHISSENLDVNFPVAFTPGNMKNRLASDRSISNLEFAFGDSHDVAVSPSLVSGDVILPDINLSPPVPRQWRS